MKLADSADANAGLIAFLQARSNARVREDQARRAAAAETAGLDAHRALEQVRRALRALEDHASPRGRWSMLGRWLPRG